MAIMNTKRESAPPSPPTSAFVLYNSNKIGVSPETTATTTKLSALFERNAISIETRHSKTSEIPISYEMTLFVHFIQGPIPAATRTSIGA